MTTISSSADLIRLLESDEGFRRDVRRWVLTDELLAVPGTLNALQESQKRMEDLLAHVVERQDAMEKRHDAFERRMDAFSERMDAFSERMDMFSERMDMFSEHIDAIVEEMRTMNRRVGVLEGRVGDLWGRDLERELARDFRRVATRYFGAVRARVSWSVFVGGGVQGDSRVAEFEANVEKAEDAGVIGFAEGDELFRADFVGHGYIRPEYSKIWFLAEASAAINLDDVERARDRAEILRKVEDGDVEPFVYGYRIIPDAEREAQRSKVTVVLRPLPDRREAE